METVNKSTTLQTLPGYDVWLINRREKYFPSYFCAILFVNDFANTIRITEDALYVGNFNKINYFSLAIVGKINCSFSLIKQVPTESLSKYFTSVFFMCCLCLFSKYKYCTFLKWKLYTKIKLRRRYIRRKKSSKNNKCGNTVML